MQLQKSSNAVDKLDKLWGIGDDDDDDSDSNEGGGEGDGVNATEAQEQAPVLVSLGLVVVSTAMLILHAQNDLPTRVAAMEARLASIESMLQRILQQSVKGAVSSGSATQEPIDGNGTDGDVPDGDVPDDGDQHRSNGDDDSASQNQEYEQDDKGGYEQNDEDDY